MLNFKISAHQHHNRLQRSKSMTSLTSIELTSHEVTSEDSTIKNDTSVYSATTTTSVGETDHEFGEFIFAGKKSSAQTAEVGF